MNAPLTHMLPEDLQASNERRFYRGHLDGYIRTMLSENPDLEAKVKLGVDYLTLWLDYEHFEKKAKRLSQLKDLNLDSLVRSIYVGTAYARKPELFVSVTSQLTKQLKMDSTADAVQTIAEVVAVLAHTGVFTITKESREASMMLQSLIELPAALVDAMDRSMYLPPMVCEPKEITTNYEAPHLTFNDCVILGKGNKHAGDQCLDVINTQNKIPLSLDLEFLSQVEEDPTFEIDTLQKEQMWHQFKGQSYAVYEMLAKQGNRFYLTNKVDKRGRLYSQGYHVTSQGSPFKKAMLELANPEIITGVPT